MNCKVAPYRGWARALHITNGDVEIVTTVEVGPRILRYAHVGGDNVLKEIPEHMGTSGEADWKMRGGHRLWASPEDPAYTYFADNLACEHELDGPSAWVRSAVDPKSGLSYGMRIVLEPSDSGVRIEHTVTNHGERTFCIAPWALTVFAPGGSAIIPLPAFAPHPGDDGKHASDYSPQLALILWPYFRFSDKRFAFGDHIIRCNQDPKAVGPSKIGACLPNGSWAAYHLRGTVFCKRISFDAQATYPDAGCNFEMYTDADVLELETLAGLRQLAPGASAHHVETWSLHQNIALSADEREVQTSLTALLAKTPPL